MNALRAIPAGMLAAAAAVLGGASKLAEFGARRLAPRAAAPEPRHPSFLDTSPGASGPAPRPYAGGALYDAEADARTAATTATADDVATDDLVTAADFAADLDADDPLLSDDQLGDVAGDTVVADDALDAMVAEAMLDAAVSDAGLDAAVSDAGLDAAVSDAGLNAAEVDALVDAAVTAAVVEAAVADAALADAALADAVAADVDFGADPLVVLPAPVDDGTAADVPSLDEAVLGGGGTARTYESHIAELAERNVASVVREIQDLSTEELGQLFEYESAHRQRKTVLQAIERATAPDEDSART